MGVLVAGCPIIFPDRNIYIGLYIIRSSSTFVAIMISHDSDVARSPTVWLCIDMMCDEMWDVGLP